LKRWLPELGNAALITLGPLAAGIGTFIGAGIGLAIRGGAVLDFSSAHPPVRVIR
jgi:hypothetical protein